MFIIAIIFKKVKDISHMFFIKIKIELVYINIDLKDKAVTFSKNQSVQDI